MIQRLKTIFAGLLVLGVLFAPMAIPATVSAENAGPCTGDTPNINGCLDTGACLSTDQQQCAASQDPNGSVNRILTTIINVFSLVVGIIAVIMIIIGGIRFVLSGGDSNNVSAARNTIIYAIVGLVVVALAQVIVHFVLNRVQG